MEIKRVVVGYLECNCYLLYINNEVLVIDPGDEYKKIKRELEGKKGLGVLITHRHFDHIGGVEEIVRDYGCPVYDYYNLEEGIKKIGNFGFEVIRFPGHSKDLVGYYFRDEKMMFLGDFIFKRSIGRCDLEGGNELEMEKSLEKIKKYSDDIIIYPGHGEKTSLGEEKKYNRYFGLEK